MEELTAHKLNGLNDALNVRVALREANGTPMEYVVSHTNEDGVDFFMTAIPFQLGPIKEAGVNGLSHEALLAIIIHRLEFFQSGPYKCWENAAALNNCRAALDYLHHRTRKRLERGVEGTSAI